MWSDIVSNIAFPLIASLVILTCSGPDPTNEVPPDSVAVHVEMVALDNRDTPVVVLEENEGSRVLNIWIGPFEAQSIAAVMEDREMPRPNTHDLGVRMLRLFEGEVARVVVSDLRQGIYFAVMTVRNGDALVEIDARPSDAIATTTTRNEKSWPERNTPVPFQVRFSGSAPGDR